jgi:tRNA threonylcarbamoyladenosine biosynthesis protein TsaB
MMQPTILSIETCTLAGSLALSRGTELLGVSNGDAGSSHSNTLLKEIDALLSNTRISLTDIDIFAVASGPGSFTGLRIGIATVKALATTLQKPTVGVSTLAAIALSAGVTEHSVTLLPAGRGEVFTQLFSVNDQSEVTSLDTAAHLSPSRMLDRYSSLANVVWCGPGAQANRELIAQRASERSIPLVDSQAPTSRWRIAPVIDNLAVYCGMLAAQRYQLDQLEQAHELRAVYVRPSDAELNA